MNIHVCFYTRPHRNINTHIFNTKGSKQIQNNHVSFHGVDENNDNNRDEGEGVLLLQLLLPLVPGQLNKESGYGSDIRFRSAAVRISPLITKAAHMGIQSCWQLSHHQEGRICLPEKPTQWR